MPDTHDRYTDHDNATRPVQRPQGNYNRPSVQNPRPVQRPNEGYNRPSAQSPRPVQRPNEGYNRPSAQNPRPVQRPQGNYNRPSAQNPRPVQRPNEGYNRPSAQNPRPVQRPQGSYNRPSAQNPRPAQRPQGNYNRPSAQNPRPAQRPQGSYNRPSAQNPRPAQRPQGSYNRPSQSASRFSRVARRAPKAPLQIPQWASLGLIALIFMVLIALAVKGISSLSTHDDRTVITPHTSETQSPLVENTDDSGNMPVDESTGVPSDEPTDTPSADTQIVSGGRTATIRMAGDIVLDTEMLDACYDKSSDSYDFAPYFSLIGDTLSKSDYTMINLDASLRKGKYGYSGYPQFTTPPSILQVVKNVGVDMITMCNNHMLDAYCDGLVESVGHVEAAGLDHIGGYVDEADSNTPEIYTINGIRVGFVSYTHSTNTMEKYCDERAEILVNRFKNADFQADVDAARAAGAEVVVAVAHWGEEYKRSPDSDQEYWAKKLVAAGVDLIIGGHPHMVQPAEYITATDANGVSRTALCVYSIGNFLTQHRVQYTDSGIVFEFTLTEQSDGSFAITDPGYVPVYVWTFKNAAGDDDYRVLATGNALANRPDGMSDEQYLRMQETWNETTSVMGGDTIIKALTD